MDFVTHSVWGLTIVRKRKFFWLIILFSVLPDIAYPLYRFGYLPNGSVNFYYFTHSLLAIFLVFFFLYLFKRPYLSLTLPYLAHVLIDIPTHCGLFSTRLFYPFSDLHICGWRFEEHAWPLLLSHYLFLGLINFLLWRRR